MIGLALIVAPVIIGGVLGYILAQRQPPARPPRIEPVLTRRTT